MDTRAHPLTVPPLFFLALFITLFLAVFYNTVTNTAGLYIASDLGGGHEMSVYPLVLFSLGNVVGLPLARPMVLRWGAVRSLIFCLWLYALIVSLCVFSPTFLIFNIFRFLMGYTAGPFYVLINRLFRVHAPLAKRDFYTAIYLLLFVLLPVVGSCFGAWLAYEELWRWIFHVNQPIAIFLACYFHYYCKKYKELTLPDTTWNTDPFNYFNYTLFSLGICALVLALMMGEQLNWYQSSTFVLLVGCATLFLLLFALRERQTPHPLFPFFLLRNFQLSYALINVGMLYSTYFGMIILIPLWLNIYASYTPIWIALLVGTMAVISIFTFVISYHWLKVCNPLTPLAIALIFIAYSCYYSTGFNISIDFYHLSVARMCAGVGIALFLPPLFHLIMDSHHETRRSDVFVFYQMTRCLATSLGSALYVILWQRRHIFFYNRLGEQLTQFSQLTRDFLTQATSRFSLSPLQSLGALQDGLDKQATSLALNDAFDVMGWIAIGLFIWLLTVAKHRWVLNVSDNTKNSPMPKDTALPPTS